MRAWIVVYMASGEMKTAYVFASDCTVAAECVGVPLKDVLSVSCFHPDPLKEWS